MTQQSYLGSEADQYLSELNPEENTRFYADMLNRTSTRNRRDGDVVILGQSLLGKYRLQQ